MADGINLLLPNINAQTVEPQHAPLYLAGFGKYQPPQACKLYEIAGSDSQIVEIQVPPGQVVTAEAGTMCHMDDGFERVVSSGGCFKGCGRCCCAGEACFRVIYTNNTSAPLALGLTPNFPAKIVPIDLNQYSGLTIASGKFVAAISADVEIKMRCASSCLQGCCGGHGFILNSIHGTGICFLNASGTILTKKLADGESLLVDTESLVAFERGVQYKVKRNKGCINICCGGEGLFNTLLRGPGLVIIQSMTFEKIATAIRAAAPAQQ